MIETDRWPFVQARHFRALDPGTSRGIRVIVIHDMEYPEQLSAAEDVARYFQDPRNDAGAPVLASAHVCVDDDSIVQCVHDHDIAYAAPGCNSDGLQIELAGYGRQTREQWLDEYSRGVIENAANVTAQYALKFGIPVIHLTNDALARGERGIIGHVQASQIYKGSDHTDPGPNFPWDVFLDRVAALYAARVQAHA